MLDEIAVEKRVRWDSKTNSLLGICREHGYKTSMTFESINDVDVLYKSLDDSDIHYATEVRLVHHVL
jgi:hypothetical protein